VRFLIHPDGSSGDVNPLVGVGAALRRRGHEVVVLCGDPFRGVVAGAGLEFRSLFSDEEYRLVLGHPDLWEPRRGVRLVLEATMAALRRTYDALRESYRPGETVLVGHSLSAAMRIFEDEHAAPAATVHLAPSVFRSDFTQPVVFSGLDLTRAPRWIKRAFWSCADRVADGVVAGPINRLRSELGLAPVARVFHRWIHAPRLVIGLFPEWFGAPQPDWPGQLRLAGFSRFDGGEDAPEDPSLETFMAKGEPPILFTPGTAHRQASSFFEAAVDAASRLERRALLVTPYAEQIPARLPPEVLHVAFAPFARLLPRCAAVVHHGGIGTCSRGLQAGIPQLAMPMAFDQPDNAARLQRLGVGTWLTPRRFTGPRVARSLEALLESPAVLGACRAWRKKSAADGAERAAEILERFATVRPS
jgi:UDP:flavonoid glycosyltransferase YjiC (YdhE family)